MVRMSPSVTGGGGLTSSGSSAASGFSSAIGGGGGGGGVNNGRPKRSKNVDECLYGSGGVPFEFNFGDRGSAEVYIGDADAHASAMREEREREEAEARAKAAAKAEEEAEAAKAAAIEAEAADELGEEVVIQPSDIDVNEDEDEDEEEARDAVGDLMHDSGGGMDMDMDDDDDTVEEIKYLTADGKEAVSIPARSLFDSDDDDEEEEEGDVDDDGSTVAYVMPSGTKMKISGSSAARDLCHSSHDKCRTGAQNKLTSMLGHSQYELGEISESQKERLRQKMREEEEGLGDSARSSGGMDDLLADDTTDDEKEEETRDAGCAAGGGGGGDGDGDENVTPKKEGKDDLLADDDDDDREGGRSTPPATPQPSKPPRRPKKTPRSEAAAAAEDGEDGGGDIDDDDQSLGDIVAPPTALMTDKTVTISNAAAALPPPQLRTEKTITISNKKGGGGGGGPGGATMSQPPRDNQIYDLNEIGSLSTEARKAERDRRMRQANVAGAIDDLEASLTSLGGDDLGVDGGGAGGGGQGPVDLSAFGGDRWATREAMADMKRNDELEGGDENSISNFNDALGNASIDSLDAGHHDRMQMSASLMSMGGSKVDFGASLTTGMYVDRGDDGDGGPRPINLITQGMAGLNAGGGGDGESTTVATLDAPRHERIQDSMSTLSTLGDSFLGGDSLLAGDQMAHAIASVVAASSLTSGNDSLATLDVPRHGGIEDSASTLGSSLLGGGSSLGLTNSLIKRMDETGGFNMAGGGGASKGGFLRSSTSSSISNDDDGGDTEGEEVGGADDGNEGSPTLGRRSSGGSSGTPKVTSVRTGASMEPIPELQDSKRSLDDTQETEKAAHASSGAEVIDPPYDDPFTGAAAESSSSFSSGAGRWSASQTPSSRARRAKVRPSHLIDLQDLRRLSSQGVPDRGSHRGVAWRVLLGYLPPDTSRWEEVLNRDRTLYRNLVTELFVRPDHGDSSSDRKGDWKGGETKEDDVTRSEGRRLRGRGMAKDGVSVRDLRRFRARSDSDDDDDEGRGGEGEGQEGGGDATAGAVTEEQADRERAESGGGVAAANGAEDGGEDDKRKRLSASNLKIERRASARARNLFETTKGTEEGPLVSIAKRDGTPGFGVGGGDDDEKAAIAERRKLTSNADRSALVGADAPVPVHRPETQDGLHGLVPARVREQWKKSGRDAAALAHISGGADDKGDGSSSGGVVNTLLVVDDRGYTPDGSRVERISVNDDPLSLETDSKWAQFFENASLLDEIRKDVVRTHPDLHFFLEPEDNLGQRRYAAIERILFVWAKLNKGVRYVQGMNEIVGTIYFVLANDSNEEWACEAEADTYFLFNTLMVEMRDVFVPDLDEADTGIQGRISNMIALLSLHDPEVRCHLDDCGIDPSFYSIRWLTTLLSREFSLPETIRLWDSMFASTHKDNFLRYVSVTMLMVIRDRLLRGDFGTCLRLLQSFPPTDIDRLLESSRALWIYESQVTLACHKGGISLGQALATIAPPPSIIMAYGLHGGIALDRAERIRQAGEKGLKAARGAAKEATNTVATAGKSFFGSAKGLWGDWRSSRITSGGGEEGAAGEERKKRKEERKKKRDFRRAKTT